MKKYELIRDEHKWIIEKNEFGYYDVTLYEYYKSVGEWRKNIKRYELYKRSFRIVS